MMVVDRIEGDKLIIEVTRGEYIELDRSFAPKATEGDVLRLEVDETETIKRKCNMQVRVDSLFKGGR